MGGPARSLAVKKRAGASPGIFWLGGFRSDMEGSKARALDAYGAASGRAVTRFDYSGHGQSGGRFEELCVSDWLGDAQAVFAGTEGPQIIVGSSMGGWIALLLCAALRTGGSDRVAGLVLVAPAVDMTRDLMLASFSEAEKLALRRDGRIESASNYGAPDVLTEKLIDDGEKHLLFGQGSIVTGCPVHILQGGQDQSVPPQHAMKLLSHLTLDAVTFTLIPDGDHSLSRDQDLRVLERAVAQLAEGS